MIHLTKNVLLNLTIVCWQLRCISILHLYYWLRGELYCLLFTVGKKKTDSKFKRCSFIISFNRVVLVVRWVVILDSGSVFKHSSKGENTQSSLYCLSGARNGEGAQGRGLCTRHSSQLYQGMKRRQRGCLRLFWYGSPLSVQMNPAGPDLATISYL